MGVTHIEDSKGNTLWSPNSLEGAYTVQKASEIVSMLSELLSTTSIKIEHVADEETLTNIYTKEQSNEIFTKNDDFENKVVALVAAGLLLDGSSLDDVYDKFLTLWKTCYGTDFDGNKLVNNSYNVLISNLTQTSDMLNTYVLRVMGDIYPRNPDGSLDMSKRIFASVSNTGTTSNLNSDFEGESRESLAKAINFVQSEVGRIDDLDSNLDSSNVVEALNKIYNKLEEIESRLG